MMKLFLRAQEKKGTFRLHRILSKLIDWYLVLLLMLPFGFEYFSLNLRSFSVFFLYLCLMTIFEMRTLGQLICSIELKFVSNQKMLMGLIHQGTLLLFFPLIAVQLLFGFTPLHQKLAQSYYIRNYDA